MGSSQTQPPWCRQMPASPDCRSLARSLTPRIALAADQGRWRRYQQVAEERRQQERSARPSTHSATALRTNLLTRLAACRSQRPEGRDEEAEGRGGRDEGKDLRRQEKVRRQHRTW